MVFKSLPIAFLLLTLMASATTAREWKGIVPLKSTRADVERLLGKPNQLGRYEIENERVNFYYSEGPCDSGDGLAEANCECLVAKDTVLKIVVTFDHGVKVSKLGIDKKKYERTPFYAYRPTATYADFTDGVVYTIVESDDIVTNISYLPSARDCEAIVRSQKTATTANGWQGIVPMRSVRTDVERLLGPSKALLGNIYRYDTVENRVDVTYSSDPCQASGANAHGTATDVVLKITVTPRKTLLVKDLHLDKQKYIRVQNHHPENWVEYINSTDAITVEAMIENGCEQVISLIYRATSRERQSRCERKGDNE